MAFLKMSPLWRLYLTVMLIAPAYVINMSPLQYEIKDMVCEAYFKQDEPGPEGCDIPEVDAAMAASIASLSMVQLFAGETGLDEADVGMSSVFFATLFAKRIGLKRTLVLNVAMSIVMNALYLAAVYKRGELGLTLIFLGQFSTAIGGLYGASLAVPAMISMLTEKDGSTSGALGFLGGIITLNGAGSSVVGGFLYNWNKQSPFIVCLVWITLSAIVALASTPDVPLNTELKSKPLDVLRIFGPRTVERDGKEVRDWSLVFAAAGAALSIIATSYTSTEIYILGINAFAITPREMGALSAWMSLSKAIFLILLFPRLSRAAFRYLDRKKSGETQPLLNPDGSTAAEPLKKTTPDLYFLIASIVLELAAVIMLAFSTQKWHLFALSTFIPEGTGVNALIPALILHFVPRDKRPEAVGAAKLLDAGANIAATFIFGYIFAWLTKLGVGNMVFLANGAVGILALVVLLFVRMP